MRSQEIVLRIEQIAQQWARDNSFTRLRSSKRRDCKTEALSQFGLTKAQAWKAVRRAIAIKREALS